MTALLLRSALLVSSLLALACSDDGSSASDPADGTNQAMTEDIDACSGHFICQDSDDKQVGEYFLEPGVLRDGRTSCNFIENGDDRGLHFLPKGAVDEGLGEYRWYRTDLGFAVDYEFSTQSCIAKSRYKPGAFQNKGSSNGSGSSSSSGTVCRDSGQYCFSSSACCSGVCNYLTGACY